MCMDHQKQLKMLISQIKHDEVKPKIILADIGMVTETDVTLAKASNAVLIAFNVNQVRKQKNLLKMKILKYLHTILFMKF